MLLFILLTYVVFPALPSDAYCPPITPGDGSELFPQRSQGGNVTMYRDFHSLHTDPHLLNITWIREPSPLNHAKGCYETNTMFSNNTVIVSITVWNLSFADMGSYTVTVCSNCTCQNTTFFLSLFECNPEITPQPLDPYRRHVIAETSLCDVLPIDVVFYGSTNEFFYPVSWTFEGDDIQCPTLKFNCSRTKYGKCTFTASLIVHNPSYEDKGNYTVEAASHNATFQLDIVQEPSITCTKHHISVGHIECHIHNYSEFVNVSIVKDDVTRIETYHASDACTLTVSEPNVARCRIELQQEGSFKICMNYTSIVCHVEPLHRCSHYVHVNDDKWIVLLEIILPAALGFLCAVIVLVCVCYYCKRWCKKRRMYRTENSEHTELLNSDTSSEDLEPDTNHPVQTGSPPQPPPPDTSSEDLQRDHSVPTGSPPQPPPPDTSSEDLQRDHPVQTPQLPPPVPQNRQPCSPTKVILIYPQNPENYEQIESPRSEEEVISKEKDKHSRITEHRKLVAEFAVFLKGLGLVVAFDQDLDDQPIASKPLWLEENIKDSDYVIFEITPSFMTLLKNTPDEEIFFKGNALNNLIGGLEDVRIVCVFLDRSKNRNQVPLGLRGGNMYELWQPFRQDSPRHINDDLTTFVSLMSRTS